MGILAWLCRVWQLLLWRWHANMLLTGCLGLISDAVWMGVAVSVDEILILISRLWAGYKILLVALVSPEPCSVCLCNKGVHSNYMARWFSPILYLVFWFGAELGSSKYSVSFFFLRWSFTLIAQARVQWHDRGSPRHLPLGFQVILLPQPP